MLKANFIKQLHLDTSQLLYMIPSRGVEFTIQQPAYHLQCIHNLSYTAGIE